MNAVTSEHSCMGCDNTGLQYAASSVEKASFSSRYVLNHKYEGCNCTCLFSSQIKEFGRSSFRMWQLLPDEAPQTTVSYLMVNTELNWSSILFLPTSSGISTNCGFYSLFLEEWAVCSDVWSSRFFYYFFFLLLFFESECCLNDGKIV